MFKESQAQVESKMIKYRQIYFKLLKSAGVSLQTNRTQWTGRREVLKKSLSAEQNIVSQQQVVFPSGHRSPIQVLTTPDVAWLRWSNEYLYNIQRGMAFGVSPTAKTRSYRLNPYYRVVMTSFYSTLVASETKWIIFLLKHC